MSKWKCGICNSEFDNYQAQGFNGTIYCPLCYFKELYKRVKQEKEDYKSRNEKAVEYIKNCPEYLWENVNTKVLLNILNGRSDK